MMLNNMLAMILNQFSIALMGLLVSLALLALVWPLIVRYIIHLSARSQKNALWLFVATPLVISIMCVLVFLPPLSHSESWRWLTRYAHWHHPGAFDLDSWHSVILFGFFLGVIYVLARKGLLAIRHLNSLYSLNRLTKSATKHSKTRQDFVVLDCEAPSAFTAGIIYPKCYVTTGLIERVSKMELDIIIAHERAHIKHKDTRNRLLFALFASFYPRSVVRRLNRMFSLATEQLADAHVGKSYCVCDIAQTLVKAARIQRFSAERVAHAGMNYFIGAEIDLRVRALIVPQVYRSFPLGTSLTLLALTMIVSFAAVDGLHHLIEVVFSH